MKISIFNANDDKENRDLDEHISCLAEELGRQHKITNITLRDLNINYCNGCWGCWVKKPGECVINDDIPLVQRAFIQSDLVIFAAPMKMGFPSSLMKKVNDRLIPLVHPYIELVDKEAHHVRRYDTYPYWALFLQEEAAGSSEDIQLVSEIYRRTALNIKSSLLYTFTTNQSAKEICHEIDYL